MVQQKIKSSLASDWKTMDSSGIHLLRAVTFSFLENRDTHTGYLIPSGGEGLPDGGRIVHYDALAASESGFHDYWIVCQYQKTKVILTRKIPENIVRCEVRYTHAQTFDESISDEAKVRCFDTPLANATLQ
jgi:hypothetical protein